MKSITTTAPSLNVGTIGSGVNPNKSLAPQIARGALSSQFTDVTNKINYYKATTQIKSKAVQFSYCTFFSFIPNIIWCENLRFIGIKNCIVTIIGIHLVIIRG